MDTFRKAWSLQYVLWLLLLGSVKAKPCYLLEVKGVVYWPEYNGFYDMSMDEQCNGRNIYIQRNTTKVHYLYYYKPDSFKYGWLMGPDKCTDRGYIYGWNTHKRPDYMLRNWMERTPAYGWVYNTAIYVRCTEGLSYGAVVGIIVACVFGLPIIGILIFCAVKKAKNKKKSERTPTRNRPSTSAVTGQTTRSTSSRISTSMTPPRPETGTINITFDPEVDLPPYSLEPPVYEEMDSRAVTSSLPVGDVTHDISPTPNDVSGDLPLTPPSYDDVLAEDGRGEISEDSL